MVDTSIVCFVQFLLYCFIVLFGLMTTKLNKLYYYYLPMGVS